MKNLGYIWVITCILLLVGCTHEPVAIVTEETDEITLIWHQSYATETMQDVLLGLNWTFANMGATNTNNATNGFEYNLEPDQGYLDKSGIANNHVLFCILPQTG